MVQFHYGSAVFWEMVDRGEFLEYAQVFGKNWYGTPRTSSLDDALCAEKDLVLEIDVQGALQVKRNSPMPWRFSCFCLRAPNWNIEFGRAASTSEDEIQRRLECAARR